MSFHRSILKLYLACFKPEYFPMEGDSTPSFTNSDQTELVTSTESEDIEKLSIFQAQVYLEDAENYRTIHHKINSFSLKLIRFNYSRPIRCLLAFAIFLLMILPFFEFPSSLSMSASVAREGDQRIELPCGVTQFIELLCLLVVTADAVFKGYIFGIRNIAKSPWLIACYVILSISYLDWFITVALTCSETHRIRRFLRPFFLVQSSPLMKKIFKSLRKTIPEMLSTLFLLFIWLIMATIFGMYMVNRIEINVNITDVYGKIYERDHSDYFSNFFDTLFDLTVLLTTANHPDIMMPVYNVGRVYACFFMIFLFVGLYVLINILTVVVYNQFRGYFLNSIQTSYFRRRVAIRAAFEVLQAAQLSAYRSTCNLARMGVPVIVLQRVLESARLTPWKKRVMQEDLERRVGCVLDATQFQTIFDVLEKPFYKRQYTYPEKTNMFSIFLQKAVLSKAFLFFGALVSIANVILLAVEISSLPKGKHHQNAFYADGSFIYVNAAFIFYYFMEQVLKFWAFGSKSYFSKIGNAFDCILSIVLMINVIASFAIFRNRTIFPDPDLNIFWDAAHLANLLIIVRAMRIVIKLPTMRIITVTLWDLCRNMPPVAGLFVVIYYVYALLGMAILGNKLDFIIKPNSSVDTDCGTYYQMEYWSNNFDDFAASLLVLWDLMVVNNWQYIVAEYTKRLGKHGGWIKIYFVSWWLLSVIIVLNVFLAVIIENFTFRWDRYVKARSLIESRRRSIIVERSLSFHYMFHDAVHEPKEEDILKELRQDRFLNLDIPLSNIDDLPITS